MGTRGGYTVIKDGHYYSCYQHWDMYPQGHPVNLLAEASDIARNGDWDEVIDGWVTKEWVDDSDSGPPASPPLRAGTPPRPLPPHPDGGNYGEDVETYLLRPRLSRSEYLAGDSSATEEDIDEDPFRYFTAFPSWRAAAAMPAMHKGEAGDRGWKEFEVILNADDGELVFVSYQEDQPIILAAAPMDDHQSLLGIATAFSDLSHEVTPHEVLPTPTTTATYEWDNDGKPVGVADGQWKRPSGFPPLEGQPADYPAKHYGPFTPRRVPTRTPKETRVGSTQGVCPPLTSAKSSRGKPKKRKPVGGGSGMGPAPDNAPGGRTTPRCNKLMPRAKRHCEGPKGHKGPCR